MNQGEGAFSKIGALINEIQAIDLSQLNLLEQAQEALQLCMDFINLYNHLESRGKDELKEFLMSNVLPVLRALGFLMTINADGTVVATPDRSHPSHANQVRVNDDGDTFDYGSDTDDDTFGDGLNGDGLNGDGFDSYNYSGNDAAFAHDAELQLPSDVLERQKGFSNQFRASLNDNEDNVTTSSMEDSRASEAVNQVQCEHMVQKSDCLTCTGVQQCSHHMPKIRCDRCSRTRRGPEYCQHNNVKYTCVRCNGFGICKHGKQKVRCSACNGSHICEHGKEKNKCRQCLEAGKRVAGFCDHGISKYTCRIHGSKYYCPHDILKSRCKECGGSGICTHGMLKNLCRRCGGASVCTHGKRRYSCKECKSKGIFCEHGRQKSICKECNKSEGGGSKTRKSKKSYSNVKMSFRKKKVIVIGHKKTKRCLRKSSRKSSRKLHI